MPSWFGRNDWESVLGRWTQAGLLTDETIEAIRAWETERATHSSASRLVDALSYLGVSVALVAALMLSALTFEDGGAWIALPFIIGVVAATLSWWSHVSRQAALSDGFAGSAVVLIAVGLGWALDEASDVGQESIGWLLISLCVVLTAGLMTRLVGSRIAVSLATLALSLTPMAIAVSGDVFDAGIFGDPRALEAWALWATFATALVIGVAVLFALEHSQRWLSADLEPWARLGASLGLGLAVLILAGGSPEPLIDWFSMLAGWLVTAWAFRRNRVELLPASALLLVGALAGGLSDLGDGTRIGLTLVVLFTALELTALGMAGSRWLGQLADHWLTPLWESALLGGGVAAAAVLAAESEALAAIGIVWALVLLVAGVVQQRRLELFLGVVGVYAAGLTLVLGQFESSLGAIVGTLLFGLLIVFGAIIWRQRSRRLTLDEADS